MDIQKYFHNADICQYALLDTGQIPFSDQVAQMCRANQCGKYGTCWTCPPGAGTPEELERKIKAFRHAGIFTCTHKLEDSFDFEGMMVGQQKAQKVLRQIMAQLRRDGETFMALGCEGCGRCAQCTYPNAPCRFPQDAVPSVEACGIHVTELARRAGLRYGNGNGTVTYFCVILFD